jgi:uncharacterized protein YkwD
MLATFALCAGLLLPAAEPEKTLEKTPAATAVKNETTAPVDKTAKKTEAAPKDKAAAEKQAEKTSDAKKDNSKDTKDAKDAKKEEPKKEKDDELLAIEANVVSYTNTERAKHGLPPLEVDKTLMKTAREHCSWMTWNRIFQHTRRPVAENIAMGQPSSQDVVRSWMNSSGHRANILNPNHRHIGVGAYRTESGTIYWVQQFSQ